MRKIEKIRKSIKSGGNAADRRRSLRVAARVARIQQDQHYDGYEPECNVCYGAGRRYRTYDTTLGWIDPKICGCVRKWPAYRDNRCGPFRVVGQSAAKRQIGRAMRGAHMDVEHWPTWWPGRMSEPNGYRGRYPEPIRKDLYDSLPAEVRDNIEIIF